MKRVFTVIKKWFVSFRGTKGVRINTKHTWSLSCGESGQSWNSCVVISPRAAQCSRSWEAALAEFSGYSRIALAVLWWHTSQSRGVGAVSSRTKFLTGMHCFKSAADRSAQSCMKSNKPKVSKTHTHTYLRQFVREWRFAHSNARIHSYILNIQRFLCTVVYLRIVVCICEMYFMII